MKLSLKLGLILGTIIFSTPLLAQRDTPFTAQQKLYTKGNSILIGNTILGKHPTLAFNEVKILNDQVALNFVDIDQDKSTFSSSTASFTLPETAKNIKYASLHWGGLYPAYSAKRRKGKRKIKYTYTGERNASVQEVKLKINEGKYADIKGRVIFDSEAKGPFAKESPYACIADVTSHLSSLKGKIDITVANVIATTGFIEGGAAAGWLLYIVYEDDTQTPKYFTSYSGFKEVSKDEVEVVFEDLQPATKNTSSSKIMMAALEGDTRIKGDGCAIYSELKEQYIPLTTEGRPALNFFNSSVSVGHDVPTSRTPASKNTLGFDLIKMNVPDSTITSSTKDATLRLTTKQDRFYTFFLAFETEIEELVLQSKNEVADADTTVKTSFNESKVDEVINTSSTSSTGPSVFKNGELKIKEEAVNTVPKKIIKPEIKKPTSVAVAYEVNASTTEKEEEYFNNELVKIENRASVQSNGMISGYYLVTNVFKNKNNAVAWEKRLDAEGYNARTFINTKKGTTYVYIESSQTPEQMQLRKEVVRQIPHLAKTWVCRVNL